ncbi:MAG TPA: ThuA domain-containing protein, partial [Cytophagaceae bacterium]
MKKIFSVFLVSLLLFSCDRSAKTRILVFSKTTGFRHESIGAGKKAIMELGDKNGILVDTTEDASFFTESELKKYAAVVFLNCTGDLFTDEQKSELKRYIQAGGGFVGIHGAADAEHNWDYYQKLVGAEFLGHPAIQEAKLDVLDHTHLSTKGLPKVWKRKDEWYNFKNIYSKIKVLINIDEQSYNGGTNGENHPMAWVHHFDGGRSFYTALGHTNESYSEPLFLDHLWGGLQFAIGEGSIDYTKASPEEDRFVKTVLAEKLSEPMKLAVSSEGELFFVQRTGEILKYDPIKKSIVKMGELAVFEGNEDGLMGIALDPNFTINRWVYLYYSPLQGVPRQHLSRFQLTSDRLDMSTEKVVLTVPTQRQSCCHSAGDLAFDAEGNLLIAVGDNTVAS